MGDRDRRMAAGSRAAGAAEGLAALADLLGGESERSRRFLGGLIAGALVGAAVAGMALLRRPPGPGFTDRPRRR